jgi:hypothetical protein
MTRLVGALAVLATAALGPSLDVSVTPLELTVGDRAEVRIRVRLSPSLPDGAVAWPALESRLGDAEVLEVGPVEVSPLDNGDRLLERQLTIAFFEVGEAVLPPLQIEVSTASGPVALRSEEVRVTVRSVLPEGDGPPEARPPAPPQRLAIGERFWWTSGALLATCLAALAMLARQSTGGTLEGPPPLLTPRQELERDLATLRAEQDPAALHQGISMTTRRYLGRRLGFPAPESTTSEVARELRRRRLDPPVARRTESLLAACDMVMFARRDVALEPSRARLDEVVSIADAVDAWLEPQPGSEDAVARPAAARETGETR